MFDMKLNTVTLNGNVVVTRGQDVLRGQKLVVDLTSGVSRMEGGRVEGLFPVGAPCSERSGSPPCGPRHGHNRLGAAREPIHLCGRSAAPDWAWAKQSGSPDSDHDPLRRRIHRAMGIETGLMNSPLALLRLAPALAPASGRRSVAAGIWSSKRSGAIARPRPPRRSILRASRSRVPRRLGSNQWPGRKRCLGQEPAS